MSAKELIAYLRNEFEIQEINWPMQMKLVKKLLQTHTADAIKYAIDYYKREGLSISSFGFLLYKDNMCIPTSLYQVEKNIQREGSGERNRKRIEEQRSKAEHRTLYPCHLFEESRETD